MDDVIGQGREPERDAPDARGGRLPLPRRWRAAAGTLAMAAAGLAVIGFGLHHGTGPPGNPAASATATGDQASVPFVPAPAPQSHPAIVICAPSTGVCSMRGARSQSLVRIDGLRAG